MKKILCVAVSLLLIACAGCSAPGVPGGTSGDSGEGLADKLEAVAPAPMPEEDTKSATTVAFTPLPDSVSFAQLDPFDMLNRGATFTPEQARGEFAMEPYENYEQDYFALQTGILENGLPGMHWTGTATFENETEQLTKFEYVYGPEGASTPADMVQMFRLAVAAADAEFGGRNRVFGDITRVTPPEKPYEEMTDAELVSLAEDFGLAMSWGVYIDSVPCVLEIEPSHTLESIYVTVDPNNDRDYYFPDDVAEGGSLPAADAPDTADATFTFDLVGNVENGEWDAGWIMEATAEKAGNGYDLTLTATQLSDFDALAVTITVTLVDADSGARSQIPVCSNEPVGWAEARTFHLLVGGEDVRDGRDYSVEVVAEWTAPDGY